MAEPVGDLVVDLSLDAARGEYQHLRCHGGAPCR